MTKSPALAAGVVSALLAGCANPSAVPAGPITPTFARTAQPAPDKRSQAKTYQYVTEYYASNAEAVQYDYPKSTHPIGGIDNLSNPGEECSTGKHAFWIVVSDGLVEYTYDGKKQLRTLSETAGDAASCAVNPRNGDVALTLLSNGDIVVFKGGKQKGETIVDGLEETYFDGYDAKGDLFVDGIGSDMGALVEMAAGSTTFKKVSLSNTLDFPGSVQWDGKYVAITDQLTNDIYRYAVADDAATLKGTVALSGASDCAATWIAQPFVFCADAGNATTEVFKYPSGGDAIATLTASSSAPLGVVQVTK